MSAPVLAVATPCRGLVHSRTIAAVQEAVAFAIAEGRVSPVAPASFWRWTHDLPIPDCHNVAVDRAFETGADYVWLVEEDVIPEPNAVVALLDKMHEEKTLVAVIDYPIVRPGVTYNCAFSWDDGSLAWGGTGCMMLARGVLDKIMRPLFTNDHQLRMTKTGSKVSLEPLDAAYEYGGQEVTFGVRLVRRGLRISYVSPADSFAGHAVLETWGEKEKNDGCHKVTVHRAVTRWLTTESLGRI